MTLTKQQRQRLTTSINYAIAIFFCAIIAGMPFALRSLYASVQANAASNDASTLILAKEGMRAPSETIHIELLAKEIDPINKTIKFLVSGYHDCRRDCTSHTMRLHFSTFYIRERNDNRVPQSIVLDVPQNNGEFIRDVVLPLDGDISIYPFDQYRGNIAVAAERSANGTSTFFSRDSNNFFLSIDEQTPRFLNDSNTIVGDITSITTEHPPAIAFSSHFKRPFYLQYIVCLLVVLLIVTTAATILLADFSKLITGAAGIILSVWGTRSLLLGSLPPDVSIIDIILTLIAIGTLISVAVKSALHVRSRYQKEDED